MNRSERRKSGVKEKPKTYTMTDAQLAQVRKDAQEEIFLMQLAIPVLALDVVGKILLQLEGCLHLQANKVHANLPQFILGHARTGHGNGR